MKSMTIVFVCCFSAAGFALDTFPLGVHFGMNYITSAVFSKSNETDPILVARVVGSPEYQEYMMDTVSTIGKRIQRSAIWYVEDDRGELVLAPPENHDEQTQTVPIGAITYPQHLNHSSLTALRETSIDLEPSLFRGWQFKRFLTNARLAYGLDSCLGLGLNSTDCNVDDFNNDVIFINYEKQSLELTAADGGEFGAFPYFEVRIDLDHKDDLVSGSAESSNMDSTMSQSQRNKILLSLQDFIRKNFKPKHNKDTDEKFAPFEFLRAVILSGEASSSDMNEMRDLIRQVLPSELHDKIRDSVDPGYVGAIGAAYHARIYVRNPSYLVDVRGCPDYDSDKQEESISDLLSRLTG